MMESHLDDYGRRVRDIIRRVLAEMGKTESDVFMILQTAEQPGVTVKLDPPAGRYQFLVPREEAMSGGWSRVEELVRLHLTNAYAPKGKDRTELSSGSE